MNISEAKEEIKNTYLMYHMRDAGGMYTWPQVRQRPILLIGPPGIGKTAVMEQIAAETGCGLVAYTMTHHTRQSAVGLPRIVTEEYEGREIETTRYTMSEIIASMYDYMAKTGKKEGILFIDEINCVSETLTPVMLELLQNKRFGTHRVPEGWMIVAAGNPPAYNRSVRPMDIVTLDRVRRIDIEPDLDSWLAYASAHGVHGAVVAFLGMRKDKFYLAENAEDGRHFVTARGWEDLSWMLKGYEQIGAEITEGQIREFLEDPATAQAFNAYYHIRRKYGEDFGIGEIFSGTLDEAGFERKAEMMRGGAWEEKFTAASLMGDIIVSRIRAFEAAELYRRRSAELMQDFVKWSLQDDGSLSDMVKYIGSRENALQIKVDNELVSEEQERTERTAFARMREAETEMRLAHVNSSGEIRNFVEKQLAEQASQAEKTAQTVLEGTERILKAAEACFGEEQETLLVVSAIGRNEKAMQFLKVHRSEIYEKLAKSLFG